nr:retrovirus-related Pol polyprotein from transposon TNT 1-94 [Tanacetum cinerariifolium]
MLNEISNDGVNLSKHEINVGFVNNLPEKWLTFSQGLRNANHSQTLELADIYGRFVYKDNLIQKRIFKEILMMKQMKGLDKEEVTQAKVLMALADNELTDGKSHDRNGEWVDITIRKDEEEVTQAKVLMSLADNELTDGKSHDRNGEWVDITIRK